MTGFSGKFFSMKKSQGVKNILKDQIAEEWEIAINAFKETIAAEKISIQERKREPRTIKRRPNPIINYLIRPRG
jgi:hypothetical protein